LPIIKSRRSKNKKRKPLLSSDSKLMYLIRRMKSSKRRSEIRRLSQEIQLSLRKSLLTCRNNWLMLKVILRNVKVTTRAMRMKRAPCLRISKI